MTNTFSIFEWQLTFVSGKKYNVITSCGGEFSTKSLETIFKGINSAIEEFGPLTGIELGHE